MKKLKLLFYIFCFVYAYFTMATISITLQMLNPKETVDFLISIVIVSWYWPMMILFSVISYLFYKLLKKNFLQIKYWNIIRFIPLIPFVILVIIWIFN